MRRSSLRSAALALSLAAVPLTAQDPAAQLARLRANDASLAEATAAVTALSEQSTALRLQAADAVRARVLDRTTGHGRACARAMKALEKLATAQQKQQLGKAGQQQVDELRARARSISTKDSLSKEQIHKDLDPIVAQLRELVLPTRARLVAADANLAAELTALQQQRAELADWLPLYAKVLEGTELNEDVQKHLEKVPPPPTPPTVARLDDEIATWILLGLPLSARDRRALSQNEPLRTRLDAEEFAGTAALNELRYVLGLPMLVIDEKLGNAARDHSQDMATLGFFDHKSPVPGKSSFGDRASRAGTSASSENIASGQDKGTGAITAWWYSPGHHRNMLGAHGRTGLGRSAQMWTQLFGG